MKQVNIEPTTYDKLKAYCVTTGQKLYFVITQAVERYLAEKGGNDEAQ